ncbi:MAG: glycosyltransferase [Alphaproteobacteria bacterium]|nr:glycosyltransferase [Alphaproteobacteria bacterium]
MAQIDYVSLEHGTLGLVPADGFDRYSERHYVSLAPEGAMPVSFDYVRNRAPHTDMILVLNGGLPAPRDVEIAQMALDAGRRAYFHWPHENALEVVTQEQLESFARHRKVVNLYWRWRALRKGLQQGRRDRRMIRAYRPPPETVTRASLEQETPSGVARGQSDGSAKSLDFLADRGDRIVARGRGLYVRLDYWAKLKGGGSYGHTCYQAKALADASMDGLIAVTASEFALLKDLGLHQIVVPSRSELADEFTLVENGAAYQPVIDGLLALYKPAYVFERLVLGNVSVARACKRLGIPYIAEFNGSELTMSREFGGREMNNAEVLQAIETEGFQLADFISVVSQPVKDEVVALGIPAEKIIVNPNGVDLSAYHPLPHDERMALRAELGFGPEDVVLGFCGTFGGWHGIEVLAEAMPKITAARPNAKFLLIGGGNFKHIVTDMIAETGISDRVHDAGMVPQREAARLLAACDVFLSPHSRNMGSKPFFGSPTKLFEYMAYGAGIVCSDLVQLGEVMRPALTLSDRDSVYRSDARSILIRPASVEDLVAASIWLVDEPRLRAHLGANALKAARDYYSWDVHVQALWAFALGREPGGYNKDRTIR